MVAANVTKAPQKKATLLHVVGKAARDIYYTRAQAGDRYEEVRDILADHFTPLRNVDYEIYKFGQIRQREQEGFDDFMVRLREAAARCDFLDIAQQLKRQIIGGRRSLKLKEHVLNTPAITIDQITQKARSEEVVAIQAKSIQEQNYNTQARSEGIAAVNNVGVNNRYGQNRTKNQDGRKTGKCFACGYDYPHRGDCPA